MRAKMYAWWDLELGDSRVLITGCLMTALVVIPAALSRVVLGLSGYDAIGFTNIAFCIMAMFFWQRYNFLLFSAFFVVSVSVFALITAMGLVGETATVLLLLGIAPLFLIAFTSGSSEYDVPFWKSAAYLALSAVFAFGASWLVIVL